MSDITIIMTSSDGEYLQKVTYCNKHNVMKTADFSKQKIDCNNINFENLKLQLKAIEFDLEHNINI